MTSVHLRFLWSARAALPLSYGQSLSSIWPILKLVLRVLAGEQGDSRCFAILTEASGGRSFMQLSWLWPCLERHFVVKCSLHAWGEL